MIPNSPEWSAINTVSDYPELDLVKPSPLFIDSEYDVSLGPINLNDSQGRLDSRYWFIYQNSDTNQILVCGAEDNQWGEPIELFNESGTVWEISLTFDQLGRPLVFYRISADTLKLYWYNPVLEQTELKALAQGIDPNAGFDAPQDTGQSYSDAMLFYVRENIIYMRIQRDRFETEYVTPSIGDNVELRSSGMRVDNRYQVVYRHELTNYVPEPPVPPTPPAIDGRYLYVMNYPTQFKIPNTLINSPKNSDIKIEFNLYGATGAKEKSGNQLGAFGFPIYCEGAASIIHPANRTYNRSVFTNSGVALRWEKLKAARNFSLSFMYDDSRQLKLYLVINGKPNTFTMPFDLVDGYWYVEINGLNVIVGNDTGALFTGDIKRGEDIASAIDGGFFAAYNMQSEQFNWRANFTGAYYDIAVTVDGNKTSYALSDQTADTQLSNPTGNNLTISNHRSANWKYVIS